MEAETGQDPGTVTHLLAEAQKGNSAAADALARRVQGELRRMAAYHLQGERPGHLLQSTVLIDDAFMSLVRNQQIQWQDRTQFFGYAAHIMRQLLSQHARARNAAKRGGLQPRVELDNVCVISDERSGALVALDEALDRLEILDPLQSKIVEMRFYCGLTVEEVAEALGISPRTVKRHWSTARLWLYSQLQTD